MAEDDQVGRKESGRVLPTAEQSRDSGQSPDAKTIYLNELGLKPLLSRDQEMYLGRRMERGRDRQLNALSRSSYVISDLLRRVAAVKSGEEPAQSVFVFKVDKGDKIKVEESILPVYQVVAEIGDLYTQITQGRRAINASFIKSASRNNFQKLQARRQVRLARLFRSLYFVDQLVDGWIEKILSSVKCIRQCEADIAKLRRRSARTRDGELRLEFSVLCHQMVIDIASVETEMSASRSELMVLARLITRGRQETDRAKGRFTDANLRLVAHIAKGYVNRGVPLLDLIQEGNLGLLKAINRFEYRLGHRFMTYAIWSIRRAISEAAKGEANVIHLPGYLVELLNKLYWTQSKLIQELGTEPTPDQVAKWMRLPVGEVLSLMELSRRPLSLDQQVCDEGGKTFGETLASRHCDKPEAVCQIQERFGSMTKLLKKLTKREALVICLRFGVGYDHSYTLEAIRSMLGPREISRERVRQIELKALNKLRPPHLRVPIKRYGNKKKPN
jgi:RNA polymerase primary sigma factor